MKAPRREAIAGTAERLTDLAALDVAIWHELERACQQRQHAWRTPALATLDGDRPDVRTVVLREVDVERRRVVLYSDARAGKIAQLAAQPQATLLCWSRPLGWQLRLRMRVEIETDGLATTMRWARVKMSPSADDYLSAIAPGAPLQAAGSAPPASERAHFAVLEGEVTSIDWLELHPAGHRRARFDEHGAHWLQP